VASGERPAQSFSLSPPRGEGRGKGPHSRTRGASSIRIVLRGPVSRGRSASIAINVFLIYLAVDRNVPASTQNQASSAIPSHDAAPFAFGSTGSSSPRFPCNSPARRTVTTSACRREDDDDLQACTGPDRRPRAEPPATRPRYATKRDPVNGGAESPHSRNAVDSVGCEKRELGLGLAIRSGRVEYATSRRRLKVW
jgi:hypothetical protein